MDILAGGFIFFRFRSKIKMCYTEKAVRIAIQFMKRKAEKQMELSKVSTRELVEELQKREAVETVIAGPYEEYRIIVGGREIADTGPAVILRVWD